jgi:hypothetical protein
MVSPVPGLSRSTGRSIRRSRLVSSCTRTFPILSQRHRPGMSFPDADCMAAAWILLVPNTKALAVPSFALGSREADLTTTLGVSTESSAKIDGGFLEHLSRDLLPPREPGDVLGGRPIPLLRSMRTCVRHLAIRQRPVAAGCFIASRADR